MIHHNSLIILTVLTLSFTNATNHQQKQKCGLYGQLPCSFVPAPPGMTPKCATPGKTYCEQNGNYPLQTIQHLVEKFAYQRILADEQDLDFSSNKFWHEEHVHHHHFYPNSYVPQNSVFSQTQTHVQATSYNYEAPKSNNLQPNQENSYSSNPQQSPAQQSHQGYRGSNGNGYFYPNPVTPYNPVEWLKRYVRDLQLRKVPSEIIPHHLRKVRNAHHHSLPYDLLNETVFQEIVKKTRVKRQAFGREQLCNTRDTFVLPQAALNTKGNWMYVVNHEDSRQLVKSQICLSSECSNLCILPNGYNSRCEQKYAQKRLLTLDANGEGLYTDTFWFPSCCVCTLASNQL